MDKSLQLIVNRQNGITLIVKELRDIVVKYKNRTVLTLRWWWVCAWIPDVLVCCHHLNRLEIRFILMTILDDCNYADVII